MAAIEKKTRRQRWPAVEFVRCVGNRATKVVVSTAKAVKFCVNGYVTMKPLKKRESI